MSTKALKSDLRTVEALFPGIRPTLAKSLAHDWRKRFPNADVKLLKALLFPGNAPEIAAGRPGINSKSREEAAARLMR